jgi:hypothetical protein
MDPMVFASAIVNNNKGVEMIRRGYYSDAIRECTQSLELLQCGNRQEEVVPPPAHEEEHHEDEPMTSSDQQVNLPMPSDQQDCRENPANAANARFWDSRTSDSSNEEPDEKNHSFIFRDPIEIPIRTISRKQKLSSSLLMKVSIVIVFNLAMACHLSALSCGSWSQLERAKLLYEHGFRLDLQGDEDSGGTLLYYMALLNNLGLIYEISNEHEKSQECFRKMLSIMMLLLEAEEAGNIKQWGGLWSNVMPLIVHNNVAAAA